MTTRETADLRARTEGELREDIEESRRRLFSLRFQTATRQLADVSQVSKTRRRISRIATLLREREILEELGVGAAVASEAEEPESAAGDSDSEPAESTEDSTDGATNNDDATTDDESDAEAEQE